MMAQPSAYAGSSKSIYLRKVKLEHDVGSSQGDKIGMVMPLYVIVPKLNNKGPISYKEFTKRYKLCVEGLSPKCVTITKDLIV
jgi:hypothetical protein